MRLDTRTSRLAQSLGTVTRLLARLIGRVFGGHRQGTHSLAFCARVGALSALALNDTGLVHLPGAITVTVGQLIALAIAYVTAALTVALLFRVRGARGRRDDRLVLLGASTLAPAGLVGAALTIGCVSHLLADLLTAEGSRRCGRSHSAASRWD